jgi:hypothetical protein
MEVFKVEPKSAQQTRWQMDRPMVLSECTNDLASKQLGEASALTNLVKKVLLFSVNQ